MLLCIHGEWVLRLFPGVFLMSAEGEEMNVER